MSAYYVHKVITISLVLGVGGLIIFFTDTALASWQWLLMAMVGFGYTHFFIGGYYQYQAIRRRNRTTEKVLFWLLTAAAFLAGYGFMAWFGMAVFVVATLLYFMLHGYFNELTLFARQQQRQPPTFALAALMLVVVGLLLHGIGHPTWFFSPHLEFSYPVVELSSVLYQTPVVYAAKVLGVITFIGAGCLALYNVFRRPSSGALLVLAVVGGAALYANQFYPLPYVYILVGVLLYHFAMWFFFYAERFYQHSVSGLLWYFSAHAAIALLLIGLAMLYTPAAVFNLTTFLAFTTWHITVSFLNEPWFQRWLDARV